MIFRRQERKNIVIIGCSRLGAMLADAYYDHGFPVTIVDPEEQSFERLSASFGGLKLCALPSDLEELKAADIQETDEVYVVTEDDCTNTLCALLLADRMPALQIRIRLWDVSRRLALQGTPIEALCPDELCLEACVAFSENRNRAPEIAAEAVRERGIRL